MKKLLIFLFFIRGLFAADMLYPTLPGTSVRDYSKPGYVVDGDRAYKTIPNTTTRDYSSSSSLVIDGDKAYHTIPNTGIKDYSKPSYRLSDY